MAPKAKSVISIGARSDGSLGSRLSVSSSTDRFTASTNTVPVFVRLPSGSKIAIPVTISSTISHLHAEAARRAALIMPPMPCEIENTTISAGGHEGAILWDEDKVVDLLDLTENRTFWLIPTHSTKIASAAESHHITEASKSAKPLENPQLSDIHIRWITIDCALKDHRRLRSNPSDPLAVDTKIGISNLQQIAFDRLYKSQAAPGELHPDCGVEIYLAECHLSSRGSQNVTLEEIGLSGSVEDPLDIFIVPFRRAQTNSSGLWPFKCSERGLATFKTCLRQFLNNMDETNIENILELLWEVTHFPPAVIAFYDLYQNGITARSEEACAVFASCFRAMCLEMVPPWISSTPETVLEASRQIFSWLYSVRSQSSQKYGAHQALIHKVEIREIKANDDMNQPGLFKYDEIVQIMSRSSPGKKFKVSKERIDGVTHHLLALALDGTYSMPWNTYFCLPPSMGRLRDHQRVPLLHQADFDNLLQTTNQDNIFKMIGPLQLTSYPSSSLPAITLNADGCVALYDGKDIECAEKRFFILNYKGEEDLLPDSEPGQFLLQKLVPIIAQRQKEGNWEIDAWTENGISAVGEAADEAIVICIDRSSSMGTPLTTALWLEGNGDALDGQSLSRLSEVKDVFKNFVTRLNAYKLNTHLGLVTFSGQDAVRNDQQLTQVTYDFKDRLDAIDAKGSTALWDAINMAKNMLVEYKAKHTNSKLRIITLTDGEDNSSKSQPSQVCADLYGENIVLDAIVIGTLATDNLFRIAKHSGGYAFVPKTRAALYQIFLLETFVDINMRPEILRLPVGIYSYTTPKRPDMEDIYNFPPCRPHTNQDDHFIALADANRFLVAMSSRGSRGNRSSMVSSRSSITRSVWSDSTTTAAGSASGLTRILLSEVRLMIDNPHPHMDVYVSESNMGFWKVVMQGPPASPYDTGTFLLYIEIGNDFPRKAPAARFITPILHPNISKHGRICHPIFDREWNPSRHVHEVLQQVWGILMALETREAIDPLATLKFFTDPQSGRKEVAEYIARFATQSREMLRYDIVGVTSSVSSYVSCHSIRQDQSVVSSHSSNSSTATLTLRDTNPERPVSGTSRSRRRSFFANFTTSGRRSSAGGSDASISR